MSALDNFLRVAPPIDDHREDAARCCEETARFARGERGPLRLDPADPTDNEFRDAAAGIASEVAIIVLEALKGAGVRSAPAAFIGLAARSSAAADGHPGSAVVSAAFHRAVSLDTRIHVAIAELTVGSRLDPKLAARLGIDLAPVIAALEGHLETLRAELRRMTDDPYPRQPGEEPAP